MAGVVAMLIKYLLVIDLPVYVDEPAWSCHSILSILPVSWKILYFIEIILELLQQFLAWKHKEN